jgi:hypothetical protein
MLSNTAKEEEPVTGKISATIADVYASTVKGLEDTLKIVIGNANHKDEYKTLPAPRDDIYSSPIAKFFNTGAWLVELDESNILASMEEAVKNIERKVVHEALVHQEWVLVLDPFRSSSEDCYSHGQGMGRSWIEFDGEWQCVMLRYPQNKGPINGAYREPDEDFYNAMEKYGMDNRYEYFQSILDCSFNDEEDYNFDVNRLTLGQVPRCFFTSMPIWKVVMDMKCGPRGICKSDMEKIAF